MHVCKCVYVSGGGGGRAARGYAERGQLCMEM